MILLLWGAYICVVYGVRAHIESAGVERDRVDHIAARRGYRSAGNTRARTTVVLDQDVPDRA